MGRGWTGIGSAHHPFMHQSETDSHEELSISPKAESERRHMPSRALLRAGDPNL